jgi:hypothetical protein
MKWLLTFIIVSIFFPLRGETILTSGYSSVNNSGGAWIEHTITVDISLHTAITIDVDYGETGTMDKFDQFEIHYRLDGAGAWSKPVKIKSDMAGDASLSIAGLEGLSLVILIRMKNDDATKTWWYDNLIVTGTGPLPVELIYFEHRKEDENVVFDWMTGSEINNHCFIIERSSGGILFEPIDTIMGNGNTTTETYYTFVDYSPIEGVSYYRLKQIDYDGQFEYSPTRTVDVIVDSLVVNIYPNPNRGSFMISIDYDSSDILVVVYNTLGVEVFTKIYQTDSMYVDFSGEIHKGVYYVIGTNKKELFRKTILIQ